MGEDQPWSANFNLRVIGKFKVLVYCCIKMKLRKLSPLKHYYYYVVVTHQKILDEHMRGCTYVILLRSGQTFPWSCYLLFGLDLMTLFPHCTLFESWGGDNNYGISNFEWSIGLHKWTVKKWNTAGVQPGIHERPWCESEREWNWWRRKYENGDAGRWRIMFLSFDWSICTNTICGEINNLVSWYMQSIVITNHIDFDIWSVHKAKIK